MTEKKKRALVFGGTGQMGTYLSGYLRSIGYGDVISFGRSGCAFCEPIWEMKKRIEALLAILKPDEIYNFAGQMHAEESWNHPLTYMFVNGFAVHTLLESILLVCPKAKFFNAGSADMFDKATVHQYEDTVKKPSSPHGLSKLVAYEAVRLYREKKGLFAVTGIFFNAESPKRAKSFFAQKVAFEAARIKREFDQSGRFTPMELSRLDARRDWGWAQEYVEVAWKMLQHERPIDFVIGTGETHSCMEFVEEALKVAGLPDVEKKFNEYVHYEESAKYRTGDTMSARPSLAKMVLGWEAKYKMKDVVRMLVEAEVKCGESIAVGQS